MNLILGLKKFLRERKSAIILLIVLVPFGFYSKLYSGPLAEWVNDSLGGVLYVIFWCLVFYVFVPTVNPLKIAALVFIITCVLELLQLWKPEALEYLRGNFLGNTLLGSSFSWLDFLHYAIGAFIAFLLIIFLRSFDKDVQQ